VNRVLVGKPEGKRWVDNIKMNLQELGCEGMDLIDLAQDRDSRLVSNVQIFYDNRLSNMTFIILSTYSTER
jgi:hypothetical protein